MGSKIEELLEKGMNWLQDQEWFQDLQDKWNGLDPQVQNYARLGGFLGGIVLLLSTLSLISGALVGSRSELEEKAELLKFVRSATDEVRALKSNGGARAGGEVDPDWPSYFSQVASRAGMQPGMLQVSQPRPGKDSPLAKELLFSLSAAKVNIKQAVKLASTLEDGVNPVKLRNFKIITQDAEGYLNIELAISAFNLVKDKK